MKREKKEFERLCSEYKVDKMEVSLKSMTSKELSFKENKRLMEVFIKNLSKEGGLNVKRKREAVTL